MNKQQTILFALVALSTTACEMVNPDEEFLDDTVYEEALPEEVTKDIDSAEREGLVIKPLDPCRTAEADRVTYVNNGSFRAFPSGGAAYAYGRICPRWVVDFKMGPKAPDYHLYGQAWDLPSSLGANGTMPNNAHDCSRFNLYVTYYHKKGAASFKNIGSARMVGSWNGTSCSAQKSWGNMQAAFPVPQAGDVYRVAVAAKLRRSYQEVRAVGTRYAIPH